MYNQQRLGLHQGRHAIDLTMGPSGGWVGSPSCNVKKQMTEQIGGKSAVDTKKGRTKQTHFREGALIDLPFWIHCLINFIPLIWCLSTIHTRHSVKMPFDQVLTQTSAFCIPAGMIKSWFGIDGGDAKIDFLLSIDKF